MNQMTICEIEFSQIREQFEKNPDAGLVDVLERLHITIDPNRATSELLYIYEFAMCAACGCWGDLSRHDMDICAECASYLDE